MPTKLLLVDDEASMRKSLANLLRREGYSITEAAGGKEAAEHLGSEMFDLVITDLKMEPVSGFELLRLTKQSNPGIEVIVITAFGTIDSAVDAMKLGAFDFITKPFLSDEILVRVRNALDKRTLTLENIRLQQEVEHEYSFGGIIGQSKQMQEVFALIRSLSETNVTAIIEGETGTGKELIARAIHYNSPRRTKRFLAVNCGALAETLLESELFGHEKGAFTGAASQRRGIFEVANGGTLFLDEIGEMAPGTQVKLLRVLQEGEFQRVGGTETIKVDVRIVAATNRSLSDLMNEGRFRPDLFYRLNVVPLRIPPLRERVEDLPLLLTHFIGKYNQKNSKQITGTSPQAKALLMAHNWPGNVRELENVIQRMMVVSTAETLDVNHLPAEIRGLATQAPESSKDLKQISRESKGLMEKNMIVDVLNQTGWNVTRSAQTLGVSRTTLQNKMKAYGLRGTNH